MLLNCALAVDVDAKRAAENKSTAPAALKLNDDARLRFGTFDDTESALQNRNVVISGVGLIPICSTTEPGAHPQYR